MVPPCNGDDRGALLDIYAAARGDLWVNSGGWNSTAPLCTWYGVQCAGPEDGRATSLDVHANGCTGARVRGRPLPYLG